MKQTFILNKTLELVNENGLEKVSMRKIAEKCEIPLSSLYTHYASKDELLNAIFEYSVHEAMSFTKLEYSDVEDFLIQSIMLNIEKKQFFQFIFKYQNSSFVTEEAKNELKNLMRSSMEETQKEFEGLAREGIDYKAVGFIIRSITRELANQDEIDEEFIKNIVDIIINGSVKERNVN